MIVFHRWQWYSHVEIPLKAMIGVFNHRVDDDVISMRSCGIHIRILTLSGTVVTYSENNFLEETAYGRDPTLALFFEKEEDETIFRLRYL